LIKRHTAPVSESF